MGSLKTISHPWTRLSLLLLLTLTLLARSTNAKAARPLHAIQATAETPNFTLLVQFYQGNWYDLDRIYIIATRPEAPDYPDLGLMGFEFTTNPPPADGSCTNLGPVYNPKAVPSASIFNCSQTFLATCPPGVMTQVFGPLQLDQGRVTGRVASINIDKGATIPGDEASLYGHALRVFPVSDYSKTLGCGTVQLLTDKETLMGELLAQNPDYVHGREKIRFQATAKSDLIASLCVVLGFRNLFYAMKILLNRTSRLPVHWFCFLAALSQIAAIFPSFVFLTFPMNTYKDPCDWLRFTGFIFSTITTASVVIVQFFKARSANPSYRTSINSISAFLAIAWIGNLIATCIILEPKEFSKKACFAPFEFFAASTEVFWLKVSIELASNLILGVCFIASLAKQRRITGLLIYDDLLKDGLLYSLLVCSSNIICPVLYVFHVLADQAVGFYAIDFAIATTLTVQQLRESRIRSGRTRKRATISAIPSDPMPLSPISPPSSTGVWARSRFSNQHDPSTYRRADSAAEDI